jgi:hypothetical protein
MSCAGNRDVLLLLQVDPSTRNTTFGVFGTALKTLSGEGSAISSSTSQSVVGGLSSLLETPTDGGGEKQGVAAEARGMVSAPTTPAVQVLQAMHVGRATCARRISSRRSVHGSRARCSVARFGDTLASTDACRGWCASRWIT